MTAAVLRASGSWRYGFAALGGIELALGALFVANLRRWPAEPAADDVEARTPGPLPPGAWASVLFFACYTGFESSVGLWISSLLVTTRGLSAAQAGAAVSLYWGALTVGRFVLGAAAARTGPHRLVRLALVGALVAATVLVVPQAPLALTLVALVTLGFSLAPLYPTLMHDTPARFGASAAVRLVGYQVAAASAGVALLPWMLGALARATSLRILPPLWVVLALTLFGLLRWRGAPRPV